MSCAPFDAIQIGLASPEMIRSWSYGEVKKPETINYRTLKPERDGLFCERIFGPTKDWECHCGKYKKIRYKGKICDRCGVEVTKSNVRRERMGHIELAAPVSHIWYFKGIPSRMGLLLDLTPRILEKVLYFAAYIVIDPGMTPLHKNQILTEKEYREMREKYEDDFRAGMGAEAIRDLLADIDCEKFSEQLRVEAREASGQKKAKLVKRLEVVEAFRQSGNNPTWMIIDVLPVIPPEIRPMVQLDGGRFATSDLNDLYRRVINRNNRLKRLIQLNAPDIIVRNEKRMLQEAVDALIDNGRRGRAVTGANSRALKSLSDMLKGKQGRFRQNLLGKRVDYSGRSVIVVGPELKLYQCGVPKEMAIELFRPFVMKKLVEDGVSNNIKSAKKMVDKGLTEVWDALEVVIREHPVLLNRAPTLHRLGIQAFEPILVEGRALKLHPLVCTAYNADFDGDQMAIHVPLSAEAQAEARVLMLSANNLLHPKDGQPVTVPTQDMILGSYYLTFIRQDEPGAGKAFSTPNEALMAYQNGDVGIHAPIKVRVTKTFDGMPQRKLIETTVGRIIFNEPIPQDLGFVDRTDPEHKFDYEIGFQTGKKQLEKIIKKAIAKHGFTLSAELLDNIKALGFKYSTRGAITISISDMTVPETKRTLIRETEKKVVSIEQQFKRGFITDDERYRLVVKEWETTTKNVTNALQDALDEFNPIFMMANSGARGSMNQIRQLAGMRGLMANTAGKTIEIPIKANFREGLTVLEYFTSSRGARKGLADTALRTADSGYLTRRLVDVSQDVIIREHDCGTHDGIVVAEPEDTSSGAQSLADAIHGRFPSDDITDPATGEILFTREHMFMSADAATLDAHGIREVKIRTVLDCEAPSGVCSKCYGINLATGDPVSIGEAVGVIAAQSIGEPGTQLTMRTFHTGGVAGDDITQGLPRVEELFEARKPKKMSMLAEISGTVEVEETRKNAIVAINITNPEDGEVKVYQAPYSAGIRVKSGDTIQKGDMLTDGALNPHDVMRIRGKAAAQTYLIQEVQKVYRQQGVEINDKHIEVIVRQMLRKVRIEEGGDTELLAGTTVDILEVKRANREIDDRIAAGETELRKATAVQLLMGITKASLATESFLSAASFQETTKVLTEAAIKGKVDHLVGLKENVIIGKLVPAGSGLSLYRKFEQNPRSDVSWDTDEEEEVEDLDLSVLLNSGNAL
ncbi:DNA-directed RNA polymerase subunit beta' [Sporobacter termitidis DSM 10068]|uniref:DNA-directed RNA polymerase subunit beta' n=1 Tax=Sporobacter termitidis DSM 10068 TaxID=1123282 RepID=A0A1M5UMJ1_9FIRM|nr:DNA-directed RNA polymerase subunit beta' [Sporobacter termitidis]SHH64214.1 DNA-directed RNA polymerase subunit beta' [Sporobacter termitidis DSM 10068]